LPIFVNYVALPGNFLDVVASKHECRIEPPTAARGDAAGRSNEAISSTYNVISLDAV
jgi:hypothetical protein